MLHNPNIVYGRKTLQPAAEAKRLQIEYKKLRRRLTEIGVDQTAERGALSARIGRVTRDLGGIQSDCVAAVEAKLKVALDLLGSGVAAAPHKLLSSAAADLHYMRLMSDRKIP